MYKIHSLAQPKYHKGVVEGGVDVGNAKDVFISANARGTVLDHLLFFLLGLALPNKYTTSLNVNNTEINKH